MAIMVSNKHMYVQFIDDDRGATLASATTCGKEGVKHNVQAAAQVGRDAAEAALRAGIKQVVVDRGGFAYHGRVKAIVDGAVAAGLAIGAVGEAK
jgi:large subunit ribosomal protein L18